MSVSVRSLIFRIIFLGVIDVLALQLAVTLGRQISPLLGIGIAVFTIVFNIVFLSEKLYPWRWIMPALAGMFLLIVYPIGYSVIVAFTNYGDGHLLTKEQVIDLRLQEVYSPQDAPSYQVYLFRNDDLDAFRFWLIDEAGQAYTYSLGDAEMVQVSPDDTSFGPLDDKGVPAAIGEYNRLPAGSALRFADSLSNIQIEATDGIVQITRIGIAEAQQASLTRQRWSYDAASDTLTNLETNTAYRSERGNFVTGEGETREVLEPGFPAFIGLENILGVIQDPDVRGPFWTVFVWTVMFATFSVFLTLTVGLGFALVLNTPDLPWKTLWRSILIIPYAVPGWLLVTTWRGLLNPVYGPVNVGIESILGISPQWFSDPTLAKLAVLFVNTYLGFPYMMLISLGVLQSIPADMYEAATIDGASAPERFRFITVPQLLIAMAPLLVASFSFNFNNFTVIELFNNGGPPMGAAIVAGHTDILLSYTYQLAFEGSTGTDYGFAAAVGIFIFFIVGPITFFNFRLTRQFEEAAA